MPQDNKAKFGIIAAVGALLSVLGFVFYKFFPKMKECCQGSTEECCGSKMKEKCCPPKKK
jgi:hypothetical protein